MTDTQEGSPATPPGPDSVLTAATPLARFTASPTAKLILIGIVTMMLLIPSTFVWLLVEERAGRAAEVASDIARSWGDAQTINGPYIVVPYSETFTTGDGEARKEKVHWRTAVLFPEKLDIAGAVAVEERRKSIYSLPVYTAELRLAGRFAPPPPETFRPHLGGSVHVDSDRAALVIGIGDVRALKNNVDVSLGDGRRLTFEPGLGPLANSRSSRTGINAPVSAADWRAGFVFDMGLRLNGSTAVFVAPAGQTTSVALTSDWPHPGFTGTFLPDTRDISATGFAADWSIPYLARGIPKVIDSVKLPLEGKMLGVKFVEPVDFYQTISRSLKYAIGFFSLTFLAVFVLEMRSGWSFHWVQYGLVGLALIVFYILLLAFAEHVGYGRAYLIAATAASALNAAYVGVSLKSRLAGTIMLLVMTGIYGVLYALMREQDYALLVGSVIAFVSLAVTMFATRTIDWSGASDPKAGFHQAKD